MPTVTCTSCSAALRVPESAAGKRVRCPKCEAIIAVPAANSEVDADDERPIEQPPRRRVPDEEQEDDRPRSRRSRDDDDDDRPRRRRRSARRQSSALPWVIAIGGLVAVLVIAGASALIYYFVSSKPTDPTPNAPANSPVVTPAASDAPGGWVEFNDPRNEVRLQFPRVHPTRNAQAEAMASRSGGKDTDVWAVDDGGKVFTLTRTAIPVGEVKPGQEEDALNGAAKGMQLTMPGATEVKFAIEREGGKIYRRSTFDMPGQGKRVIVRMAIAKNRLIVAMVVGPLSMPVQGTSPDVAPFLDSFKLR